MKIADLSLMILLEIARDHMSSIGLQLREAQGQTVFPVRNWRGKIRYYSFYLGPVGADPAENSQWTEFRFTVH